MNSQGTDRISEVFDYAFAVFGLIFIDGRMVLITSLTVVVLFMFRTLRSRFWIFFHLTFPSTLMHELTHYVVSLVLNGKPQGLSVVPVQSRGGLILGHVTSVNMRWYNGTAIALAPFSLFIFAYYFFLNDLQFETSFFWLPPKIYLLASLIEGGIPSGPDFRLGLKFSLAPVVIATTYLVINFKGLHQLFS